MTREAPSEATGHEEASDEPWAAQAQQSWDEAADAWDHFVESGLDPLRSELHGPALLDACGDVQGRDVLDLGCGQGWFSRQLARRGARVTGLDWSARLIAHGRRREQEAPLGIRYEVGDAALLGARFADARFALVTGCMSLMDMPAPQEVLRAAASVLAPDGRVVFTVSHPVTETPRRSWKRDAEGAKVALELDGYFETAPRVMHWTMPRLPRPFATVQYRHTLERWIEMIGAAGLRLRGLREPRPTPDMLARCPKLEGAARMPYFLLFDLAAA